ncbi:MAG: glutathione peroxidase [Verrucomicrobia bacterium]|nr:glutathione peroxidase [Verrucomicrobiota bacterium]
MGVLSGSAGSLYEIPFKDIEGKEMTLEKFKGKTVLVVNVASRCGYTPQYKGLQELYTKYKDKGLVIVGFPSNDFGAQEPGTDSEILAFCKSKFDVTFPMMSKITVKGDGKHPFYKALTEKPAPFPGEVSWNFNKFLIGKNGEILARYKSGDAPDSKNLISQIEKDLGV